MDTDRLYRLTKEDAPKIIRILTECFREDPLYQKLIPREEVRERALPGLFRCDAEELLGSCDVFADSPEVNGLMIVDDENEPWSPLQYYTEEAYYALKADAIVAMEDWSLRTLWNFILGRKYLSGEWTDDLKDPRQLHIIYFAVRPQCRGTGLARKLMAPVLDYADSHGCAVSLETHNPRNLELYRHYGFLLFQTMRRHLDLKQYCLVRPPKGREGGLALPAAHAGGSAVPLPQAT